MPESRKNHDSIPETEQDWKDFAQDWRDEHEEDTQRIRRLLLDFEERMKGVQRHLTTASEKVIPDPDPKTRNIITYHHGSAIMGLQTGHGLQQQIDGLIQEQIIKFKWTRIILTMTGQETPEDLSPNIEPDGYDDEREGLNTMIRYTATQLSETTETIRKVLKIPISSAPDSKELMN